jgi:hypothetical protein
VTGHSGTPCRPFRPATLPAVPKKPAPPKRSYELRVALNDTKPSIWRTFRIPAHATLLELHYALQIIMGWSNSHLHEFRKGEQRYAPPNPEGGDWDEDQIDTDDVLISELLVKPKDKLAYLYDFGDGWEHTVTLIGIMPDDGIEVICTGGERACPPDDCGGPGGYARLLTILANPKHPEHKDMLEWFREGTHPEHDVAVCPLDGINEQLEDGIDGLHARFDEEHGDVPEDEDDVFGDEDGEEEGDGKIIQFPAGR